MNFFKSRSNGYFLILSIVTLIFLAFIFYFLTNLNDDKKLISKLENSLTLTKDLLEEQKRYALSLSILLSQDEELVKSFQSNNRVKTFNIVNKKIKHLKKLQDSNFEVQIHTKDLNTYLRSWDFSIKDISLSSFRQGLVKVKENKKPLASIELGKRLNIKAISPILKDNKFIGSIEIIIGFEYLTKELQERGYDIFILLDNKYLDVATSLKNHEKIDGFTLVNHQNKTNKHSHNINLKSLKDYGYFTDNNFAFSYFTYYSLKREKLGYIIVSLENSSSNKIQNNFEKKVFINDAKVIIE